jgi:hypothetical protein
MIFRLSILGGVVHELTENFFLPQIKFVSRECNRVAHELASIGSLGTEGRSARMYGDFSVQRFSWFGCLMESCIPLNKKKEETFQITNRPPGRPAARPCNCNQRGSMHLYESVSSEGKERAHVSEQSTYSDEKPADSSARPSQSTGQPRKSLG